MKTRTDPKNYRTDLLLSTPDEVHPTLGGETMICMSKAFAPEPAEIRRMLLKLRKSERWSQGFAAAALGASRSSVVKWEARERIPSGPAAKLIFLYYSLFIAKGTVRNIWDLVHWGAVPCRKEDEKWMTEEVIQLNETYYVTKKDYDEVVSWMYDQYSI